MILLSLSRYDIKESSGSVEVTILRTKKPKKPMFSPGQYWNLITDEGKEKHFSIGMLRFLLKNPTVSGSDVHPGLTRIRFRPDGSVMDLYGANEPRALKSCEFKSLDEALATVLCMKDAANGNLAFASKFIAENRELAVRLTAHRLHVKKQVCRNLLPEAEEYFLQKLTLNAATCRQIVPLLYVFCNAIRGTYLRSLNRKGYEEITFTEETIL